MDLEPMPAALRGGQPAGAGGAVPGRSAVALSPERRALLGVRSEEVRETRIDRAIRTVGRVTADERRLAHVHTKFEGYVERLYVDFTGKFVTKGDPLLSIYSPELIATQQEYLLALRAQAQLGASQFPSVARGGASLADAARERLRLWDISPADIAELERTGTVRRAFDLHAEVSGFVLHASATVYGDEDGGILTNGSLLWLAICQSGSSSGVIAQGYRAHTYSTDDYYGNRIATSKENISISGLVYAACGDLIYLANDEDSPLASGSDAKYEAISFTGHYLGYEETT